MGNLRVNLLYLAAVFLISALPVFSAADAAINGISAGTFNFTAREGRVITPDGNSIYAWGYANGSGPMQYPGATMIVNQGDTVTVNLTNALAEPVSMVFPGQSNVTASGGSQGLLAMEAAPGQTVTYSFIAENAGTYLYHSGTDPALQVEMGLLGALVVRPYGFNPSAPRAYNHPDAAYERENLFLLTEMDPRIHELVEFQGSAALAATDYLSSYSPVYWFINGRCAPDTMAPANAAWLPSQPYDAMVMVRPGERLLMRVVNAGRDLHPFHHHGNHARIMAVDGRMLESAPGAGPDNGYSVFTVQSIPGQTVDAVFQWTGKGLGWDIYGTGAGYEHTCTDNDSDGFDDSTVEYCPDHAKPFPVTLPGIQDLTLGGFYSGTPFLGVLGQLPPGQGGMNPSAGYFYMWHSHTEKEMTNFDIFPGGMMTMLIIEAPAAQMAQ